MIQIIATIFGLISIVVSIFLPFWGWIILDIAFLILAVTFVALKQEKFKNISELSDKANELIKNLDISIVRNLSY